MLDNHICDKNSERQKETAEINPAEPQLPQGGKSFPEDQQLGIDTPPLGLYAINQQVGNSLKSSLIRIKANGFFYCTGGEARLLAGEREVRLTGGELYVYTPHIRTEVVSFTPDIRGIVGIADFDFVQAALTLTGTASHRLSLLAHPAITLGVAERHSFDRLLEAALTPVEGSEPHLLRLRQNALAQAICYELLQFYTVRDKLSQASLSRRDIIFDRFLQHIRQHCHQHRDIAYYAELQCITPGYLASAVRHCSQRSPQDWLSAAVINEARRLLAEPQLSIKEISQRLNFPTQTFFGSYFRRQTGQSPSAFRRSVG